MIKCGECGYENMDGLDYCDGCGAKLGAAAATPSPSANGGEGPSALAEAPVVPPVSEPALAASEPAATAPEATTPSKAPTGEMTAPSPTPAAAAAPAPFKAKLSITRGGRRNQEFELETGNNLVGRWDPETGSFPEVDLDADDTEAKISRKHALIRLDGGKITIEDIGSLNGTYVNRQPRLQPGNPTELKDGDEVIIGKTFLKLTISPIS
ncbi:MAG TPA: FHA domain-containing protein [Candidatus Binataceae bacterium]|nr:FHA domain-containing protein [Candidatus Binataceae bacterium]